MVPIFRVADGASTAAWYERLGFELVGEHRFAPDLPLYLFLGEQPWAREIELTDPDGNRLRIATRV